MQLSTVCLGCICLARYLCSPHVPFAGSWDGRKEQTAERPLVCSSLLLSLSGSCTAPAPLLSKLINLMSPHAHEKLISSSGLVNLSSPLLPIQQQRSSNHTVSYAFGCGRAGEHPGTGTQTQSEDTRAPSMLCHQPFCIISGKSFTCASVTASAHYPSFCQCKVKAASCSTFGSLMAMSGTSLTCWGPHWGHSVLTETNPQQLHFTSKATQSRSEGWPGHDGHVSVLGWGAPDRHLKTQVGLDRSQPGLKTTRAVSVTASCNTT